MTYLGGLLTIVSFLSIIFVLIKSLFFDHDVPHGIPTIIVLSLFFGGLNMLSIAVIGEYQGKILEETKRRPKFIRRNIFKKE